MSLSSQVQYNINATVTSARSVSTASGSYTSQFSSDYQSANNVFTDSSAVLAASATATAVYDLSGSLENAIGDPYIINAIQNIQIINNSISSALTVLGGATDVHVLTSSVASITIGSGGRFNYDSPRGLTVTSTTSDTITLSGTGARFEIMVIGTDA